MTSPVRPRDERCGEWNGNPGNVLLNAGVTGLPKDSVANVSRIALDKQQLIERCGKLSSRQLDGQ